MSTSPRSSAARVLGGAALLGFRQVANAAATVISAMILIRTFGIGGYGQLTLVVGVAGLFAMLGGNFDEIARRFLPEHTARRDGTALRHLVRLLLAVRLTLAAGAALVLVATAPWLESLYAGAGTGQLLFRIGAMTILAAALDASAISIFIGLQQYRAQAVLSLVPSVGGMLTAFLAAATGMSLASYFAAWAALQLGAALLSLGIALSAAWRAAPGTAATPTGAPPAARRYIAYAWPLWGSWIGTAAYQHLGRSLLGLFAPAAVIGAYSLAKAAVEQLGALLTQVPVAMLPDLAGSTGATAHQARRSRLENAARLGAPLLAAVLVATVAAAPEIFAIIGGGSAAMAASLFALLALQLPCRVLTSVWGTLYFVEERTRSVLVLNGIRLTMFAVAALLLIPAVGAPGAAVAEVVAFAAGMAYLALTSGRILQVQARTVLAGVPSAMAWIGVAALMLHLTDAPALRLPLAAAAVALILAGARERIAGLRPASSPAALAGGAG